MKGLFEGECAGLQLPAQSPLLNYVDPDKWRPGSVPVDWLPQKFEEFLGQRQEFLQEGKGRSRRICGTFYSRNFTWRHWLVGDTRHCFGRSVAAATWSSLRYMPVHEAALRTRAAWQI